VTQPIRLRGEQLSAHGVRCASGDRQYDFVLTPDSRRPAIYVNTADSGRELAIRMRAPVVRAPPATNHLGAECIGGPEGAILRLLVNGRRVLAKRDPRGPATFDSIALVSTSGEKGGNEALFDNLLVRARAEQ
jgi:hypothetical protein